MGGSCVNCAVGMFAPAGATTCKACPNGKSVAVRAGKEEANCLDCGAGKYARFAAPGACQNCAIGMWAAASATACTACPNGKSVAVGPAGRGLAYCVDCRAGTFVSAMAPGACTQCRSGTYSPAGASICTNCPAGRGAARQITCTDCPEGKFAPAGAACGNCDDGQWSDAGQSSCRKIVRSLTARVCVRLAWWHGGFVWFASY